MEAIQTVFVKMGKSSLGMLRRIVEHTFTLGSYSKFLSLGNQQNMKKLKVLTVVGTRPEIIRLACVLQKLDASDAIEHILVHTGQNYDYELNEVFFEDLGLRKPDHFLNAAGRNATETEIGRAHV